MIGLTRFRCNNGSKIYHYIALFALITTVFASQFIFSTTVNAATNTYYVAKNGSDNNPGTQAQPWLTFQKATSTIVAGDTVYVRAGVYNERLNIVNKLGNTTQRITVKKYPNETVIIDGTGLGTQSPLFIQNSSYITVDGFEVRNSSQVGVSAVYGQNHYIELLNLHVHDCSSSGIMVGYGGSFGSVSHILINGCTVHNVCKAGVNADEGISIQSVDNFEIMNCLIYDTPNIPGVYGQSGLDCKVGCTNGKIHHNEIARTTMYIDAFGKTTSNFEIYDNYFHDTANNAIFLGCEKTPASVTNINIYNNLFYNNANGCFIAYGEAGGFTALNFKFINNTCYKNAQSGWNDITFGDATVNYQNCVIANNIIMPAVYNARPIVSNKPSLGGYTIDHNLFWSGEGKIYPESTTVPRGTSAIVADPLLVNPPTDFSISANSPAKDAGSSTLTQTIDYIGTARPQGTKYDIGAYECITSLISLPAVVTDTASGLTTTGVTLNAHLTSKGSSSSVAVSFEYGITTSYGNTIVGTPANLTNTGSFNTNLSSLTPNTLYHYRAKATGDGTAYGSDQTFVTQTNNNPPVLNFIGNRNINRDTLLSFTISATDPNGDVLNYLVTNLPSGATFNTSTRIFSWTPSLNQVGTYTNVRFQVSDGKLIDFEDITIVVTNVNRAPVINTISNKTTNENSLLIFTISAIDPDGDMLTYSASNLPSGAIFNASTRTFSWTPSHSQIGVYPSIKFQVTDSKIITSEEITITVNIVYAIWDINMDSIVNGSDLNIIYQHLNETGSPGWIRSDVNADGVVDILDTILVGQHFS
jgi:hypothetical protein